MGGKICLWKEGDTRIGLKTILSRWIWGETPAGFTRLSYERGRVMMVRDGLEQEINPEEFPARRGSVEKASPFQGRGTLYFLRLRNGENALVRSYRHGGLLRRLTGDIFVTWPPRPFKELGVIEQAGHRGVPSPEVIGAVVERVWGPFYRGWLVTRELSGARDLWAALRDDSYGRNSMDSVLRAVAQSVRRMHRRGIYHGDLNLKNILVRLEENGIRSYLIDFDKAKLFSSAIPPRKVRNNLNRLHRSARKLDPARRFLSPEDWNRFLRLYREAGRNDE